MKANIHPTNYQVKLACACGAAFDTLSTKENVSTEVCSQCHPFFTGKQKFLDTAQRLEKFKAKEAQKEAIVSSGIIRSKKEKEAARKAKRSTSADATKQSAKDALKAAKDALADI